ncbi:protein SMG7-like [Trichogramma pretiosum]|uniref:protein SMG7-like n=1 Tax=Trichogramma pretiosum TaxID=7493 RepID=UPI0006C94E46|nr:protein SMG7-like [Trichogramma pretiosum]XP_014231451.1 protein SMG7-like [Trichogramma pretiosum]XP_014231452.1 protein SMG7-like [Trichogramma pretiosum]
MSLKRTVDEMHREFQEVRKRIENLSESDVLSSSLWIIQRKYLYLGKMIIIIDLQYALRCMVEQELWNYGFKHFISILQKMSKNEKNSQRSDAQCILTQILDEAYGFYLNLLDHFCLSYDLKVPFRRNKYMGIDSENNTKTNSDENFKSLCYFICTHCLVHLGDLDRYRNQLNEAELFYRHAQSVSPTSGHAYNQLALLDVIRSNKLGTVFHYVQAIMCQHPFGPSIPNLFRTLETIPDINITNPYIELTQDELINIFLYFHKILHTNCTQNAQKRSGLVKFLNLRILAMVATNSFSSSILLQMFVINLFSIDYLKLCPTNDCNSKLSGEQQKAKQDILKLIVGQLDAMLLANYTITDSLIGNNALPTIKLCFQWISTRSSILNEPAFSEHSKIWKGFCTVLNILQIVLSDSERPSFPVGYPLPEDVLVQGFSPLEDCLKELNFTESDNNQRLDSQTEMYLRVARLIELGHSFTSHLVNGAPLIKYVGGQFVVYNAAAEHVESYNPTIEPEVLDFTNETNQLDDRHTQGTSSDCRIIPAFNLLSIGQESNDILRPECSSGRSVEKMPKNDDPMKIEPNHPDSAEGRIRRNLRSFKNAAIHSILNLQKNGQINEMTRDQDFNSGATSYHSPTKQNYENVEKRI